MQRCRRWSPRNSLRFAYSHQPIGNRHQDVCKNMLTIIRKSAQIIENPCKIHPKSMTNQCLDSFGLEVAVAGGARRPRLVLVDFPHGFDDLFSPKLLKRVIFGTPEILKWVQNRTFEHRSALGPSKIVSGKGCGKNMKKQ